jgi:two-component system response regulator CpxR
MYQTPTILLVEDDRATLASLKLFLSALPYTVVHAWDGREAIDYLHNNPDTVSLILLDINMPGMGGLEFLSLIKEGDQALSTIPVILQTAATDEEVQAGLEMGADLSISKPYVGSDLYIAMINVLVKQLQQQDLLLAALNHHDD